MISIIAHDVDNSVLLCSYAGSGGGESGIHAWFTMNMNIADEASMARPVYICGVLIMSGHKCRLSGQENIKHNVRV